MDPSLVSALYIFAKVLLIVFYLLSALFLWLLIFSAAELKLAFAQIESDSRDLDKFVRTSAPKLPAIAKPGFRVESLWEDLAKQIIFTLLKKTNVYAQFKKVLQLLSIGRGFFGLLNSAKKVF